MSRLTVPESSIDTTLNTTDVSISQEEISEFVSTDDDHSVKKLNNKQTRTPADRFTGRNHIDQVQNTVSEINSRLKEKSLQLENVKSEYSQKIERLQMSLDKMLHENELLKMQLHIEREENVITKSNLEVKLNNIESKQNLLTSAAHDIQRTFTESHLSDVQYKKMKAIDEKDLSLTDFVSIKLYEKDQEWNEKFESLRLQIKYKDEKLHSFKIASDKFQDDLEAERRQRIESELKLERSSKLCEDLTEQIQTKCHKSDNYDKLLREKDDMECQLCDTTKQLIHLTATHEKTIIDKDDHFTELSSLKQSALLLKHDKEYLSKVLTEKESKLLSVEGRCDQLEQQLTKIKQAREELYEKYMVSRDQYRSEYEEKLKQELGRMKLQMDIDIEQLKGNAKELSGREMRGLLESRDMAINDRDRALLSERETATKYEQILLDFRQGQLCDGSKISELNNQLKMKTFESEKVQLLYDESLKTIKESQLHFEKLQRKIEVLLKEYYSLQTNFEKKVADLEEQLKEKRSKLEFTDRFVDDLEGIIKQIIPNFSVGDDASDAEPGRRITKCIQALRRSIQKNVPSNEKGSRVTAKEALQPGHSAKDDQVAMLKQQLSSNQLQRMALEKDKSKLLEINNQMASDLNCLLKQEKEMNSMKKIIDDMKSKSKVKNDILRNSENNSKQTKAKIQSDKSLR